MEFAQGPFAKGRKVTFGRNDEMARRLRKLRWVGAMATIGAVGCSIAPPQAQVNQVNQLVNDRTKAQFDAASLLTPDNREAAPSGKLSLRTATALALRRNLSLVAAAENLTLAHGQLVQAGLIQ